MRHLTSNSGQSLVDLMVSVAIYGVIISSALPSFDPRRQDINTATTTLIGDFRATRVKAITTGTHFSIKLLDEHQYEVRRERLDDGEWSLDTVVRTVTLPLNVRLQLLGTDTVEFNTRGMMITVVGNSPDPQPIYVYLFEDAGNGKRSFSVWPSGQINEEF